MSPRFLRLQPILQWLLLPLAHRLGSLLIALCLLAVGLPRMPLSVDWILNTSYPGQGRADISSEPLR